MLYWSYLVEVLSCLLWSLLRPFHKPCQIVHLTCPLQTHCLAEKWKIGYFHAYITCHFILFYWFENNSPEKKIKFWTYQLLRHKSGRLLSCFVVASLSRKRYAHFIVRLSSWRLKGHLLGSLSNPWLENAKLKALHIFRNPHVTLNKM